MKNEKFIVSFNLGGYAWKTTTETWQDRLERACMCIKDVAPDAWIIGLSEVVLGTNSKYIDVIRNAFPNYEVVLPKAFSKDYKSAINVLLINREGYSGHTVMTLNQMNDSLLYNYVHIDSIYGCFRLLNVHMPHTCNGNKAEWYQRKREELRSVFEHAVEDTCTTYSKEVDIQFIFMGDLNATPQDSFINKISGLVNPSIYNATQTEDRKKSTYHNSIYGDSHIDYIFYSMGSMQGDVIEVYRNEILNIPIVNKISDHCIIRGKVRTLIA